MERVGLLLFVMLFFFTGVVSASGQCNSTGYLSLSSNISAGTCNFENGTCDYYIRSPWQRNSSYILDKYYQPIKARDGGHYIVMDRHSPFIDSYGRFVSGDIPPGDYCLTFWYYITFSAVRLIGNTTTGTVFCNVTEKSIDTVSWKSHTVELHENTTFQISFTSIHVQYDWYVYKHTSLVDDIVLNRMVQFASTNSTSTNYSTSFPMIVNSSYTSMPANSTKVFATTTAAQYNVTSLSNSCSYFSTRGSCSFSSYSDTCGYTYGSKWSVNNGTYLISYYGTLLSLFGNSPGNDTIYMRLYDWEYSNKNKELLSPCLVAGNYCLDFWYNLPTNEVDMHISVGDKILRHLPTSSNWRNVFVQFSANDDFKLNFSYSGYSSRTTLFAVDDIKLYSNEAVPSRSPYCPVYTSTNITNNHTQETLKLEDIIHHGCTNTGWNITIDMNLMKQLYPNITSRNIYFGDNSCRGKQSGPYLIYQQGFRDCLTSEKISGSTFIYENELVSAVFDIINPSIIRRHDWTFTVECRIDRNVVTSSHVIHNVSSHHVTETNHYNVDLAIYSDPNFMTQLTGNPIHSQAGSYLYTKVYSTVSDWSIKMRLHTCYTDTESDVSKNTTYYLIKDGCEVDANTHIISQSTHETRFVFQDFEYSSDKGGLYVHCNATFCKSNDFTVGCRQSCNPEQLLIG